MIRFLSIRSRVVICSTVFAAIATPLRAQCHEWVNKFAAPGTGQGVGNGMFSPGTVAAFANYDGSGSMRLIAGVPWGVGGTSFLCVKSPTQRTPSQNSGGTANACDGTLSIDWCGYMAASPFALGQPLTPGQNFFGQFWFRDPPAPKTTSLSDALQWTVQP